MLFKIIVEKYRFGRAIARLPVFALFFGCTACSVTPFAYKPIIFNDESGFVRETKELRKEFADLGANDRLYRGMTISDARCNRFFDDLELLRTNARFGNRRVNALETGLPALLEAAEASSLSVSVVSAALGFVSGSLADYDELYLLSQFSNSVFVRWQQAKDDASIRIEQLIESHSPAEVPNEKANRALYQYSSLCLYSQLTSWINQAAGAGTLIATDGSAAGSGSPAAIPKIVTLKDSESDLPSVSVPSYIIPNN